MEDKEGRKYKNDEFKINCKYDENGEKLETIIERAFKSYYQFKMKT